MTPCRKLGYKVGDKFRLVDNTNWEDLPIDIEIMLVQDDCSTVPMFSIPENSYGVSHAWIPLQHVEPLEETATKYDEGKPMFDLIDPTWEEEVAKVLTFGASKYAPDNWKGLDPKRIRNAAQRHMNAYRRGEMLDEETGLPHLAHASCCLMMLHWHEANKDAE